MLLHRPAYILIKPWGLNSNTRSMSTSSEPAAVYHNPDKNKESIVKENKGKSGIYRWVHINSGKNYIGSSSNISTRFKQYFNYNHISNRNMAICKALLKYGYAEFRLEILEYCSSDKLLQREQFYFDAFNPEYNILKVAGSPLGYRHSEAAKKLISLASKDREVSESTRDVLSKSLLGKTLDKDHLEKMRLGNILRQSVLLTNPDTGETKEFTSMTDAGLYLGVSRVTLKKYLLSGTPYKGYVITGPSGSNIKVLDESSSSTKFLANNLAVLLTNKSTGVSKEFSTMTEAAEYLEVSRGRLWYFLKNGGNTYQAELKGHTISKITRTQVKVNKNSSKIEVTDIESNEVTVYPSLTLAAEALSVPRSSLSGYFGNKRTNPYKNKYILKLV